MSHREARFATTRWTLVWQAAHEDAQAARPALTELMQRYWYPLYGFARRRGLTREDAEDATQEFLGKLVQGDLIGAADPSKGRFRSFLLVAWKRFLTDIYRKEQTIRRGGQRPHLSLDFDAGEQKWLAVAATEDDADRTFLQSWAESLLAEVRGRLQASYEARGRGAIFAELMPRLTQPMERRDYEDLAERLAISPSSVKVALHRLRQRFGQTLREVVHETLDDPAEIDQEISDLLSVLGR